jgi:hypothetical protein
LIQSHTVKAVILKVILRVWAYWRDFGYNIFPKGISNLPLNWSIVVLVRNPWLSSSDGSGMMNQPSVFPSKQVARKDRKTGPVCRFIAIAEIEIWIWTLPWPCGECLIRCGTWDKQAHSSVSSQ